MAAPSAKRYTPQQREEALRLYVDQGAGEAARQTNIPRGTICSWAARNERTRPREQRMQAAHRARDLAFAERRGRLADGAGAAAEEVLARLRSTEREIDVERLAKAWGVLVEKGQLLSGDATQRIETSDQFNREVGRLLSEFERRGDSPEGFAP